MANNKIYIEMWNADTGEWEWREFFTKEIDELIEMEIIDDDMIGYAMNDQKAFSDAMDIMLNCGRVFTCGELVDKYIELSGKEVRITR